ncbi:MAG TPA: YggT family protein, partial [Blastocatellia bacterium]|nr:YggT family protein [Blastocatellia bacterium]
MQDQNLAFDESRRISQYEQAKDSARAKAQQEISRQTTNLTTDERSEVAEVGERLRRKSVNEMAETDQEVERARFAARVSQVVDYIFYLIYGLISLEILLDLMGARDNNGFRSFIDMLSAPFLAPFKSLIPDPNFGRVEIRLSYIFALFAYFLLHLAINGLLRLMAHRK